MKFGPLFAVIPAFVKSDISTCVTPYNKWSTEFNACYFEETASKKIWSAAQAQCVNHGGMLPVPTNNVQNSFMANWLSSNGEYYTWLAVTDTTNEGTFINLATNEEITYAKWYDDQPSTEASDYDYVWLEDTGLWGTHEDSGPEIFMCIKLTPPEAESCEGIFKLECLNDFKVKLTVEKPTCFSEAYPDLDVTNLVLFADSDSTADDADSCKAFSNGASGSNYFYSDADLSLPVEAGSTELYFDGKACGNNAYWDNTNLKYSVQIGTYLPTSADTVLLQSEMTAVPLTCTYQDQINDVEVHDNDTGKLKNFEIEKFAGTKVKGADTPTELVITTLVSAKGDSGEWEGLSDGDMVILGEEVKVTFYSSADTLDIHIQNCIAKDAGSGATNVLALVSNDCFQTGTTALTLINPQAGTTQCADVCSTELTFNQFAFVTGAAADPTLSFHLECEIAVGTAQCARRRRREAPEFQTVTFDYDVRANNAEFNELEGGIVVARNSSTADSSAAAVVSGLAGLALLVV